MRWRFLFRTRLAFAASLWLFPFIGAVSGAALGFLIAEVEDPPGIFQYDGGSAQALLAAIGTGMISLTGFVVTVTVLIVQTAGGTYSARYLRLWYRDPVLKLALAALVGTAAYSFMLLRSVKETEVPDLGVSLTVPIVMVAVLLFLFFLDRALHRLRPVAVAEIVAEAARRTVQSMSAVAPVPDVAAYEADSELDKRPDLVARSTQAGVIQALDLRGLLAWSRRHDCALVFPHGLGAFVSRGSKLVSVFGSSLPSSSERQLLNMIILGHEGTNQQDVAFSLRILVDVANKALSSAVNDPTTAAQALNYLEDTLVLLGSTPNLDGKWAYRDSQGTVRLTLPIQRWQDYLALAVTEIREYGATSVQMMRRLRALLEDLLDSVRPEYQEAVRDELARLDATIARVWQGLEDLDLARVADRQAFGGPPSELTDRS